MAITLAIATAGFGCAGINSPPYHVAPAAPAPGQTIVTPDLSLTAKVLSVNLVGRFVVLTFPDGRLPKSDQHLFLYRNGLRTAEVKITGPQEDVNVVADIVLGEAQVGDLVRDE
jgi:hypothetical protein